MGVGIGVRKSARSERGKLERTRGGGGGDGGGKGVRRRGENDIKSDRGSNAHAMIG